jgi:hypothetical protein
MVISAMAAPSDPGETAVHFLEKVRAKNVNLEPGADTALTPQTSEAKRKEIARRLERMARDIGNDPLEVGAVKLDGDLAGVLVRKISGFDPNQMQVFPIALVKRGAEWLAAPVPASFENSGIGYAAALRKRLKVLENWMLREQALDLATLREQSAERMRHKIEEQLPAATLRTLSSRQAAERFLESCENRNLPAILGLLGGLATELPGDWPLRAKAAERSVAAGRDLSGPWRLLVSKDVLRAIVHQEEDGRSALVSLACLDPAGGLSPGSRPRVQLVHLDLSKSSDGLWRVNPPGYFLQKNEVPDDDSEEDLDSDLLDAFPAIIRKAYPATPKPSVEEARESVMTAMRKHGLPELMSLIRLDRDPAKARESCSSAAELWWKVRDPSSVCATMPLGIRTLEKNAAASFQIFSARYPDRFDFKTLHFEKSADGWLWVPKPSARTLSDFADWETRQSSQWSDAWQDTLLANCPVLEKFPNAAAPSGDEARMLVESWLAAIHDGDVAAALGLCARLNLADSKATLLRNLGYELIGALKYDQTPAITKVHREGEWTAVGTRIDSDGNSAFPLYPIVSTPTGPRILAEVDLSASGTRTRDFLNSTSLKRLRGFSPSAADSLQDLFTNYQKAALLPKNR